MGFYWLSYSQINSVLLQILQSIKLVFSSIIVLSLFFSIGLQHALADDALETTGKVGSLAIDILQDAAFEELGAEDSGKARLDAFIKGKIKAGVKDKITGGSDVSEGMGLILNEVYEKINNAKKTVGGRQGVCQAAALNEARAIAFDAKNTRVLRGAANTWFDTITSIPGAAAMAEKLVTDVAKAGYEKLRSGMEDMIKKDYAEGKNEIFKYTRSTDSCSLSMTVIWNKKRAKYVYIIKGDCKCNEVNAAGALESPRKIRMSNFEILGTGDINLHLSIKDPTQPELIFKASSPSYQLNANCQCDGTTIIEPPREPEPIFRGEVGLVETLLTKAKCQSCQSKLDTSNKYVVERNKVANLMNQLAEKINKEPYDTSDRRAWVASWESMNGRYEKLSVLIDTSFDAFVKCEETECQRSGPIEIPELSLQDSVSSSCKECSSIVNEVNQSIVEHNTLVLDMNGIAALANKREHGTEDGNKLFRKWQIKKKELDKLKSDIKAKLEKKNTCEAENCFGKRYMEKVPLSSACLACKAIGARTNKVEVEYNELVDGVNERTEKYKQFLLAGGDKYSTEGINLAYQILAIDRDKRRDTLDRMTTLQIELSNCDPARCSSPIEEEKTEIKIGGDPIGEPIKDGENPDGKDNIILPDNFHSVLDEIGGTGLTSEQIKQIRTRCKQCEQLTLRLNRENQKRQGLYSNFKELDFSIGKLEADIAILTRLTWKSVGYNQAYRDITLIFNKLVIFIEEENPDDFYDLGGSEIYASKDNAIASMYRNIARLKDRLKRIQKELDEKDDLISDLQKALMECEKQCVSISIIDVISIGGNNPFNRDDPIEENSDSNNSDASSNSTSTTNSTNTVANNFVTGSYSCGANTCDVASFNITKSGSKVTLNPFGANGSTQFTVNSSGNNGTSNSNNLTILGNPKHQCTIQHTAPKTVTLVCKNNFGAGPGSCTNTCN